MDLVEPTWPEFQGAVRGFVTEAPTALGAPFEVVVPSFSTDHGYEIRRWAARGLTRPAVGDEVLVVEDDSGLPWVPAWWPAGGDIAVPRDWGIVEALPAGAAVGDLCSVKLREEAAVSYKLWRCQKLEASGERPWAVLGPAPLRYVDKNTRVVAVTTVQTTGAPSMVAPFNMEALVTFGANYFSVQEAQLTGAEITLLVNAVAAEERSVFAGSNIFDANPQLVDTPITVAKSQIVTMQYQMTTGKKISFNHLQMKIAPLRIG